MYGTGLDAGIALLVTTCLRTRRYLFFDQHYRYLSAGNRRQSGFGYKQYIGCEYHDGCVPGS